LERWFWATTYAGYFTSMNSTQLGRAIQHVRHLADPEQTVQDALPNDMDRAIEPHIRFNFVSARSTAFALLLATHNPLDVSGNPIDGKEFVAAMGVRALERILPQMSGTDPANRIISGPQGARDLRVLFSEPRGKKYTAICASHIISTQAAAALAQGRQTDFLSIRRKDLLALEAAEANRWGLTIKTTAA
jgi:hypothetical protein